MLLLAREPHFIFVPNGVNEQIGAKAAGMPPVISPLSPVEQKRETQIKNEIHCSALPLRLIATERRPVFLNAAPKV